jgi:hypothetical protein
MTREHGHVDFIAPKPGEHATMPIEQFLAPLDDEALHILIEVAYSLLNERRMEREPGH